MDFYLEKQLEGRFQITLDNDKLKSAAMLSARLFKITPQNNHFFKAQIFKEFTAIFDLNFPAYISKVKSVLENLSAVDIGFCLQHGDYWANNILFDDSNDVRGIIDWDSLGMYYTGFDISHLFFMNENELNNLEIGELVQLYHEGLPEGFNLLIREYYLELGQPIIECRYIVELYWISFVVRSHKQLSLLSKSQNWKKKNLLDVIDFLAKD